MSNVTFSIITIAIIALITMLTRFLPFIIFSKSATTPGWLTYLGKVLPYAIMAMLIVFCLRSVDFLGGSHGIPEAISILAVVLLHLWKKNVLLSIIAGTVLYMVLVQMVFI